MILAVTKTHDCLDSHRHDKRQVIRSPDTERSCGIHCHRQHHQHRRKQRRQHRPANTNTNTHPTTNTILSTLHRPPPIPHQYHTPHRRQPTSQGRRQQQLHQHQHQHQHQRTTKTMNDERRTTNDERRKDEGRWLPGPFVEGKFRFGLLWVFVNRYRWSSAFRSRVRVFARSYRFEIIAVIRFFLGCGVRSLAHTFVCQEEGCSGALAKNALCATQDFETGRKTMARKLCDCKRKSGGRLRVQVHLRFRARAHLFV